MLKIVVLLQLAIISIWAIDCKDLDTEEKIREFYKKTHKSNPLLKNNVSTTMDIKTNEKGKKDTSQIHSLRLKERKRVYFIEGKDSPKCTIEKSKKDYICNECTINTTAVCRSHKDDEDNTKIKGTNIDTKDFDILEGPDFAGKCYPLKKNNKYIKLISIKKSGDSEYDKVISFYDKAKEVPITMNYQSAKVLKKVYRFFPKHYVKIDGEWLSTVSRVRSVNGSEKKFTFETFTYVKKDETGKFLLYTKPLEDPIVANTNINQLFNINR